MRAIARLFFEITFLPVARLIYRPRVSGGGFVPRSGGVLLLSNHVTYIDSFVLYLTCPRRVRFVVLEHYVNIKAIGWFLKLFGAIPIRPNNAKQAISRTVDALKEGDVVCLFPEGGLTRTGVTNEFKKGFELIVRKAGCPVIPVYMDGLWNSIFSFERGLYFKKRPNGFTCPLQIAFGRPIGPDEADTERVRKAVWEASVEAFSLRRDFDQPLEKALVKSLKKGRRKPFLIEYGKDAPRTWSRGYTLGIATAIARRWMNSPPSSSDRVGILLPPGPVATAINFGLFLAGKTPVNLPFTIDQQETDKIAAAIEPLGIGAVITSRAFMSQLMDFWRGDEGVFIDMKSVLTSPGPGVILFERIRAFIEPTWMTCWRLDLGRREKNREAVGILEGPDDEPLLLRSIDLFRNAKQVVAANFFQRDERIFSEQSLSSAAGLMISAWTPALSRGRVACRSLSRRGQFEALEQALLAEASTVVAGDVDFFRSLDQPLSISSLRYGFIFGPVGAWEIENREESLGLALARCWAFAGRIATMSRTDPDYPGQPRHAHQLGRKAKSVGRFLPGIAAVVDDGRLRVRFEPSGDPARGPESPARWVDGPGDAELDAEGFLLFPNEAI